MDYRALFTIFLSVAVVVLLFSHRSSASQVKGCSNQAPAEIQHSEGVLRLHELTPQRVSVTFWSGDDAASRIENITEANRARLSPTHTHIGVNLTDSPELFKAYLERDDLAGEPYQLRATDASARFLRSTYGYRTLYK